VGANPRRVAIGLSSVGCVYIPCDLALAENGEVCSPVAEPKDHRAAMLRKTDRDVATLLDAKRREPAGGS